MYFLKAIQAWTCESISIFRDRGIFVLSTQCRRNRSNSQQLHRDFSHDRLAFRAKGQTPSGFPRSPHQKHSHIRSYQRSDIGFPLNFGWNFKFECLDIYSKIDSGTLQNICCNVVVALRSELTSPFTARSFEIPTLENHHEFIDHDCFCRQN